MVIEVERIPVNAQQLFSRLFPVRRLVSHPKELLFRPIIIDTRFKYLAHFGQFAQILNDRRVPYLVVTELPSSDGDLSMAELYKSIVFFDLELLPSQYPLMTEAARKAILTLPWEDISLLPKFLTMGYTEMHIDDDNLEDALMVLEREVERFCFCPVMAERAKELGHFKRIVASPPYLESRIQQISPRFVLQHLNVETIKCISIYWLNEEDMEEVINSSK